MTELSNALHSVWSQNAAAQERRLAVQEQAIVHLLAGTLDTAGRQEAASEAHKLAGSLGSFGLVEGSRLAGELEAAWATEGALFTQAIQLAELTAGLRREIQSGPIESATASLAAAPAPTTNDLDVLLVDDDAVFADFVLETLRAQARQVTWLADGDSAREALCDASAPLRPRLMLLDVEMPGLDGFDVLEALGRTGAIAHTSVIMLTRRTTVEDILRARKLGITDYIAKPLAGPVLVERVSRALEARA